MFRCVGTSTDAPCKTPKGKVRTFRSVKTCIDHYKDEHRKKMTAEKVHEVCKIPTETDDDLEEFDEGHSSVPMDIASVAHSHHQHLPSANAYANNVQIAQADVINLDEISSLGSLGLSALGINNAERVAMLELLRNLRNNDTEQMMVPSTRGASSSHGASSSRGGSSRR